jgi:cholesterol transport system auxiliary component
MRISNLFWHNYRAKWLLSSLAMLLMSLSACSLRPVSPPVINKYALTAIANAPVSKITAPVTLLVTTPVAAPGYIAADMIYITQAYELKHFATHRWVAPPAQMLTPLLAQSLRNTHYLYAVVTPPFIGVSDFRLDTQLLQFQQEFLQPTSQVRVVLQAELINNLTNKIIVERRFEALVPAPQNNPYSGVVAANAAVAQVLQNINAMVIQYAVLK